MLWADGGEDQRMDGVWLVFPICGPGTREEESCSKLLPDLEGVEDELSVSETQFLPKVVQAAATSPLGLSRQAHSSPLRSSCHCTQSPQGTGENIITRTIETWN